MLLERIDIDAHGSLHQVELGPFAEHLNVIYGPDGSGKTAIARFIRDSLVDREYPLGMMSSSSGRVVWADRNGLLHFRREQDGSKTGRRSFEFESRGNTSAYSHSRYDQSLRHSWIGSVGVQSSAARSARGIQLPESLVDGVVTDTTIINVARVVSACIQNGLDSPETYHTLPLSDSDSHYEHANHRAQLAEVETELARLEATFPSNQPFDHSALVARRDELTRQLAGHHSNRDHESMAPHPESRALRERLTRLHDRIAQLRARQSTLRQWITDARSQLRASTTTNEYRYEHAIHDENLRRNLDDIDAQLIRWRRTLLEVRGLRAAILATRNHPVRPLSDHHSPTHPIWTASHSTNELERRVDSATRQIDWLLERYTAAHHVNQTFSLDWYSSQPMSATYPSRSLEETLRTIRDELRHASASTCEVSETAKDLHELDRSEQWLVATMNQLTRHRESLIHRYTPIEKQQTQKWANHHQSIQGRYQCERAEREAELYQVTTELEACLSEAMQIRRGLHQAPAIDRVSVVYHHSPMTRENLTRELRLIDEKLSRYSRIVWLRTRATELSNSLRTTHVPPLQTRSPLAESASRWLYRISGGRLHQLSWSTDHVHHGNVDGASYRGGVLIDDRDEQHSSPADRAMAVLAVRMAAGELLERLGRTVPLVIETHSSFYHASDAGPFHHPVSTALRDYACSGRQVLLLTSDATLAEQTVRVGARRYDLHAHRNAQPHRPLWRPQYQSENYVGPHPHLHDAEVAGETINRKLDAAWQDAYDMVDHEYQDRYPHSKYRDGYFYADSYTTSPMNAPQPVREVPKTQPLHPVENYPLSRVEQPDAVEPAFFLTVDSPIDQAPSVDSVAAARLRGLNVTHVTHLMQQDANRLSDALGLADVDASTIRRWQSECRLVCRVPKLRGFDARVLVGCGVTTPAQLAATHPTDLLQQVEDFLATEQGQRVLLSGSSRELSRITSWIAAANSWGVENSSRYVDGRTVRRSTYVERQSEKSIGDNDRVYDADGEPIRYGIRSIGSERARRSSGRGEQPTSNHRRTDRNTHNSKRTRRKTRSSDRPSRDVVRMQRSESKSTSIESNTRSGRSERSERTTRSNRAERSDRSNRSDRTSPNGNSSSHRKSSRGGSNGQRLDRSQNERSSRSTELRFYLERGSDVVDAPSIGPRMAERLNRLGVFTVEDLINANPQSVAQKLKHRRIDSETVLSWQQQATLVCRIPMLRGHDAQLLVLADVTTAEDLAAQEPEDLFAIIDPISRSRDGKRIIRGGKLPDMVEITEWITCAKQSRVLKAA